MNITLTIETAVIALALGLGTLAVVVLALWRRTRVEFVAARIAVANLQLRMAEMEAEKIRERNAAPPDRHASNPSPYAANSGGMPLDQAIDSAADAGAPRHHQWRHPKGWTP